MPRSRLSRYSTTSSASSIPSCGRLSPPSRKMSKPGSAVSRIVRLGAYNTTSSTRATVAALSSVPISVKSISQSKIGAVATAATRFTCGLSKRKPRINSSLPASLSAVAVSPPLAPMFSSRAQTLSVVMRVS